MPTSTAGYLRMPTLAGDLVVFVSEDDLWSVPASGGTARRLTANLAEVARPRLSADGALIAFTSREEHHPEVWVMNAGGGPARRLTWFGAPATTTIGWSPAGHIVAVSAAAQPFASHTHPYAVDPEHGRLERLPFGPCLALGWQSGGQGVVLGRHTSDPARWKRYHGGTAGQIWVDARGSGAFRQILAGLDGNLVNPMWIGGRIYFLSDHEGIGNLYSCRPTGTDVRRHTDHDQYYARHATTDGRRIAYQCAAELWLFDPRADSSLRIDVDCPSPRVQRNRKFVPADRHLGEYSVHPTGRAVALETRGQLFSFPLWEENVRPVGPREGVRHRVARWLRDGESIVAVSDETGEEGLVSYGPDGASRTIGDLDLGISWELAASPTADVVAIANNRHELLLVDLGSGALRRLDASEHGYLAGPVWSPDGKWIAYSCATTQTTMSIKICEAGSGAVHLVTRAEFRDFSPAWDPKGEQLFFLSSRVFDTVVEPILFELSFPRTVKPFAVPLRRDIRSPFWGRPKGFGEPASPE
ncbi:MAG: S41 family peptidase, partial [Mycobacteriales bacterium]